MPSVLDSQPRRTHSRERALERRVRELERENAQLRAENAELRAENAALKTKLSEFEKRFAELEARLSENSTNSHRPPSSDPPWTKRAGRKKPTGRKQGAQPGHEGATRPLIPVEKVDRVVPHFPEACGRCRLPFGARTASEGREPRRHQVWEIPPTKPVIVEHQAHCRTCRHCGETTQAELPPEIAVSSFGPRLQATVALLTGRFRLSRREAEEATSVLFGVDMALGSITAMEKATSEALAKPYDEALAKVRVSDVVNADETGWRERLGVRAWLWVAVTSTLAVFAVDPRRNRDAFKRLLGAFKGVLVTDRWGAYLDHPTDRHQVCWGHLRRDFEKLVLRGGEAAVLGNALLAETATLFETWHALRRGEIDRAALRRRIAPVKARFHELLVEGLQNSHPKANGLCAKLIPVWPSLWVFVENEGVEPTNNDAERALRPAVLWRKGSFGSQSESGSTYVARVLTIVASLRKQGRHVLDFLIAAVTAQRMGTRSPTLIPQ